MGLINHEELRRQIALGELISLDDITNEFKSILKEVIQTASNQSMVHLMFLSQEIEILVLHHNW